VKAVDADSGINAEITYSVERGSNSTNVDSRFGVDSSSGEVRLTAALTPGDVNASYLVTVRATDAGTRPLSTSVRLCVTVVDRNVTEDHLRSVPLLAAGSLRWDATVMATLAGVLTLCASVVVVVGLIVVTRRRARSRRRRPPSRCKNFVQCKFVDVRNGTHVGDRTGSTQPTDEDNDDDDGCVPRTVIRTLDRSPRSSRGVDVDTRRSRAATAATWQGNSSSVLKRYEPDGCNSSSHFDLQPSRTGVC